MANIIIDAPCGAGKTTWAINTMNNNVEDSFVYCTPFLNEITRIKDACKNVHIQEPHNYGTTKIDNFNELLSTGENVAVTHSTFLNATAETLEYIQQGEYTLFLDEVLDVVAEFNKTTLVENAPTQAVNENDIKLLKETGLINIREDYKVEWLGKDYTNSKFSEIERLARAGRLYYIRDKVMVCVFPPEMFKCFKNIYVMTYLFDGSILKYYFDFFDIPYSLTSINNKNEIYSLVEYTPDNDFVFRKKCRELIVVCDSKRLHEGYKRNSFSKTWYDSAMKDKTIVKRLQNDLRHFFSDIARAHAKNNNILWTCPVEYKNKLSGKGYTRSRQLTASERKLPTNERERIEKQILCFVPLNARASNEYKERWALAYLFNMNINPMIEGFFSDYKKISIDKDMYSLSCLIQWIFRSRIRDGKDIIIYLPSSRMRELLFKWMNREI